VDDALRICDLQELRDIRAFLSCDAGDERASDHVKVRIIGFGFGLQYEPIWR
jgi:hypothetical protein